MEDRANILRQMKICRFCLSEDEPLTNIYEKDGKQSVPLPLQIMACVAIEVFANDGMPQLICGPCRHLTQRAYNFKTTCKRSDDALKLFLATGSLAKPAANRSLHQDPEAENVPSKRPESAAKKRKPNPEVVTLNYATPIEISRSMLDDHCQRHDESEHILGIDSGQFEEIVDQSSMDEDAMQEGETEDENINPVLKVPQVETDVFPCMHCERSFPLKQLLDIHMRNHERERSFACEDCGRRFFTKYDLSKHALTHSDLKPFGCVVCQKQFSRESLLHRHEKIHIDVPKYLCTVCERTFLTREDLDVHSEKHKKKRPFACRLCNKSFVFKQGLERHELTHADQKPHKCNYCEASFTSPIKLTRHITSHAGLRPYPCKLCGRTFLLSHHLTRHMKSHYAMKSNNVQPVGQHKCDVCSMSFRRKDSLINHSAIHSMVNLRCVICNTAFDSAKMVKEHITTHLSGLPYPCDRCDYSFDTQEQLEEHELKHAEMEYEEEIEKEVSVEQQAQHQEEYQEEDEEEEDEDDEDEVAEFTITNAENPEVVRRSRRESKIKNYAQFLKDELGSDLEDNVQQVHLEEEEMHAETIKPVVRLEGTKVYTRKSTPEKPKILPSLKLNDFSVAPLEQITQPQLTTFENLGLTKQAVNALPNKKYVDMKIGDKTIRVQKLMMTKAEIEQMAREGKIEMKGNTILLKNTRTNLQDTKTDVPRLPMTKPISLQSIIDDTKQTPTVSKPIVKKTYVRKLPAKESTERGESSAPSADENIEPQNEPHD